MAPVCHVSASTDRGIDDQTMQLRPGSPHTFTVVNPPQNGLIATFSYSSPKASDTHIGFGSQSVSMTYSSTCRVTARGATISLAGTAVVSADSVSSSAFGGNNEHRMPPTTYSWSVDLLLEMDPTHNGQLNYVIRNPNFSGRPTVAKESESAWDKFLRAVGGSFREFAKDPGNIRETLQSHVIDEIQPALAATIKTANHFVFPGGVTFLFKNPGFTHTDDLAANITYLAPSRAAAGSSSG